MLAKEREPSIYLRMCMHKFVCVHTSTFIMAFHRHIQTRLKAYASPEKDRFSNDNNTTDAD